MFDVRNDHAVRLEKMFQRSQRIVENSIQIKALELNEPEDVADVFDLYDKTAILGEQLLDGFDELMRILKVGEHATGDDNIGLSVGFFDLLCGIGIEKGADRSQPLIVRDLGDIDRWLDTDHFHP